MLDLGELVGFLEIDGTRWNRGIDQALRDVDTFGDRVRPRAQEAGRKAGDAFGDELADEAEKGGQEAGEKAGDGLASKGALAAGAAGTVVGLAFVEGLDLTAARDKLTAQLGATAQESRRYGRVAGKLYAGAWGESMDEVNAAIASVVTSIDGMDEASGRRLRRLTSRALDFATAFDVDVVRATQVAGVVVDSKLAKNGVRAFDLLTKGAQQVPAALREDLLDAVEEYGQFFKTLGYSGPQAFALLVEASEKGIYGIDKAGDAVKEFTIRSTDMSEASKDAYERIGLDAREMADKILAGGDDAQEATQKIVKGLLSIESPSERAEAAIALFGTPIEDLNVRDIPDFLRNLQGTSDAMDGVRGSAKRMGEELNDNAKTKVTEFTRGIKTELVEWFAEKGIPFIEDDLVPAVKDIGDAFDDIPGWVVKGSVGGVLGLLAAGKLGSLASDLRGLRGGLGGGRGVAGKATPVPVFVTNPGYGAGGGGDVPGKGKSNPLTRAGKWLGPLGFLTGASAVEGSGYSDPDRNPDGAAFGHSRGGRGSFMAVAMAMQEEAEKVDEKITGLRSNLAMFGDELDLVGDKKIDPHLTVPGLKRAHSDLQDFLELQVAAGRPVTPYVSLSGVESAMQQIRSLNEGLNGLGERGGVDVPFLHGSGASTDTPSRRGGVTFDMRGSTIKAHDYDDFVSQSRRRAQRAGLGGRP